MKKKASITLILMFVLACLVGIPSQAASYQKITREKQKIGAYYFWIDDSDGLHMQPVSKKKNQIIARDVRTGITDGKTVYTSRYDNSSYCSEISRYLIPYKESTQLVYLKGITEVVGAYGSKVILSGDREESKFGGIDTHLYTYDIYTWKVRKALHAREYVGMYKQYLVGKGETGAITELPLEVYNMKTKKARTITNASWAEKLAGKYVYYVKNIGYSGPYSVRKLQVWRYALDTGKNKAVSSVFTGNVLGLELKKNKLTYYGEDNRKHILKF